LIAITYNDNYELEQARIYAGLSMNEFDALPGSPDWIVDGERSKTHILVLYRMHNAIQASVSDAQVRDSEQKARRRGH